MSLSDLLNECQCDSDSDSDSDSKHKFQNYKCNECNYWTNSVHRFNAHLLTKKHLRNTGVIQKDPDVFECKACNYSTTVKDRLRVHNNTNKHKQNLELNPDADPLFQTILNPPSHK